MPRRSMNVTSLSVVDELSLLIANSFPSAWWSTDGRAGPANAVKRAVSRCRPVKTNEIGERPNLDALARISSELACMRSRRSDLYRHHLWRRARAHDSPTHLFFVNQQDPERRRDQFER